MVQTFAVSSQGSQPANWTGLWVFLAVILFVFIFYIVTFWRLFSKAGRPGWASLIPIYNSYVLLKIAGKSGWWFFLLCIPFLNLIFFFLFCLGLAKSFGRSELFGVLGLFIFSPIGIPILAFGGSQYIGPGGEVKGTPQTPQQPPQQPPTQPQQPTVTPPTPPTPPTVDSMTPPAPPAQ
jgi:hypothetical protein